MLKNPSLFYHHISTSGVQICQKEHVLCRTDTLNDATDKSETDHSNRKKTPPQATLDYSKTTQQKGHIFLSMTEEMVDQQKWKDISSTMKATEMYKGRAIQTL